MMQVDTQTWEALGLLPCKGCGGTRRIPLSGCAVRGITFEWQPCPDCIQDGQPTGLAFPGLTERCGLVSFTFFISRDQAWTTGKMLPPPDMPESIRPKCRTQDRAAYADWRPKGWANKCPGGCSGTGRVLLQGPALRDAAEGELGKRGLIRHTFSVGPFGGGYGHRYEQHGEGSFWRLLAHKPDRKEALRKALTAVAGAQ
jgi:hypothetical protein